MICTTNGICWWYDSSFIFYSSFSHHLDVLMLVVDIILFYYCFVEKYEWNYFVDHELAVILFCNKKKYWKSKFSGWYWMIRCYNTDCLGLWWQWMCLYKWSVIRFIDDLETAKLPIGATEHFVKILIKQICVKNLFEVRMKIYGPINRDGMILPFLW